MAKISCLRNRRKSVLFLIGTNKQETGQFWQYLHSSGAVLTIFWKFWGTSAQRFEFGGTSGNYFGIRGYLWLFSQWLRGEVSMSRCVLWFVWLGRLSHSTSAFPPFLNLSPQTIAITTSSFTVQGLTRLLVQTPNNYCVFEQIICSGLLLNIIIIPEQIFCFVWTWINICPSEHEMIGKRLFAGDSFLL